MGIPLVALSVRPQEFQDPIQNQGRLMSLQALGQQTQQQAALAPGQVQQQQQQLQLGKQAIQQGEFAVQDREAGMKAMQQWDGRDLNDVPDLIQKNGGSLNAVLGARKSAIEAQQAVMNLNTAQLNQAKTKNDYLLGKLQAATDKSIPDEQLPQSVIAATQQAIKDGYLDPQHAQEVQQMIQQFPNPADLRSHLSIYEKGLQSQTEQFNQEQKNRETTAAEQTAQSRADTAKTSAERLQAELPGGPLASVDKAEMTDYIAKNPTTAGHPTGPADFLAYKATLVPKYNFNLQNNSAVGQPAANVAKQFGMTPEAFDQAAEKYYQTGNLPPVGRGAAGPALQKAIMNRTGELHPGASLAEGSAEYKANSDSLKKIQSNFDAVSAFENTALKNIQLFRDQAQKVIDTGIPLLNAPVRSAAKLLGSENQAGFDTALQVANNEIAKVTSSPGLSGVLSDSARKEVEDYNPKSATIGQAMHVADILTQDMANRHQSYQQQIADIKTRLGGSQAGAQGGSTPQSNAAPPTHTPGGKASGLTEGATGTGSDGKKYVVRNGVWQPQ